MAEYEAGKFDSEVAQRGYDLNRMCHALNAAAARTEFLADEQAYCDRFGLSDEECDAVMRRDKRRLFALGGNMYFLAKLDRVPRPVATA